MNKELEKEFVNDWKTRLKAGVEYRKQYSSSNDWEAYRKQYRGQWDKNIVPVNKVFSYGRNLIPRVYFNSPRITVTATHPSMVAHARVVEAIDNMLIRETVLKKTIKKAIIDAFVCGISPIKLGFDSEFGYVPEQTIDADGSTVTQVSKSDGERIEYRENIKPGMPWALRCRPEDIIVPWGTEDPESLPWIAHYILRPLKDVKNDSKYKNTKDLKGTREPSLNTAKRAFRPTHEKDKDEPFCELYEIRDFRTGNIIVLSEDYVLLKEKDALQIEGLPYEFLTFNDDPEYIWGISDASILQHQQSELNKITTQTVLHRAIALIKFLFKKDALKDVSVDALLSGEVGPGIPVDDDNVASAVHILQPHIPPDLYNAANATINAMRESVGFSSNEQVGSYTGTPRSASEVMQVAGDIDQRHSERRDIVGDLIINIIRKWNQYIFSFWTQQRASMVVGPEGATEWVLYTGDQLRGEYFLHIDVDSGMPINKSLKYQMGKDLFGSLNGDPFIDPILLHQILLDGYGQVDPRIPQLLAFQEGTQGMDAKALAAARQPSPAAAGGGKGSGGGRSGSSIGRAQEFDSFRKRFEAAK